MPDEDLRPSWGRTEQHLRDAIRHQPLAEDERTLVLDFVDHNEFGVAFEWMTSALVEAGARLRPEARDALAQAAREMGLEDNAAWIQLAL